MKSLFFGVVCGGALGLVMIPACTTGGFTPDFVVPNGTLDGGAAGPRGIGERCDDGGTCRTGLTCKEGICAAGRSLDLGSICVISAECKDGQYCGPERKCAPAGTGEKGATCGSDGDCKSTFRCNIVGFGAECQPEGAKDLNGVCASSGDCLGGLLCANKVCLPAPAGLPVLSIPSFKGVVCETETGPVTAHFRVPRSGETLDYFRLPFPNDIRKKGDKLDLTNFPTPGSDLLGFDLVDRWARYLELTGTGWSAYPTVTFRFSGEVDFDSLRTAGSTKWVDLTEGVDIAHTWSSTTGRSAYVCPNSISYRPGNGQPLKPGHTYATIIATPTKAKDGAAVVVSPDLTALLGAADPGGDLSAAYKAYEPLRKWAADKSFNLATIVNAAVFTVGKHDEIAKKLAVAVAAAPAPTASKWTKCAAGVTSPCGQLGAGRECPATSDPSFDELHAVVKLPRFQQGNLPFMEPADGGDFVLDAGGQPQLQGDVEVCMALTVPTGAAPASGWPLVVYAHGTGGSFRSHANEVAPRLSNIEGKKIAVLGIDQVGHGTRRGASTALPQNVFFNFTNPAASRGNVLQGAADQMALVRFAKGLTLTAAESPTTQAISIDPTHIAFWGHSQGATEGAIAIPYTPDVVGAVFSGVGGSLIDSLLSKKSPTNLAAIAPAILSDLPANVNSAHPVLTMFQNAIDPADPLDHAAAVPTTSKHFFVPYGQGDTYAPTTTQVVYILASGVAVANAPASVAKSDDLGRAPSAIFPLTGNVTQTTFKFTQAARQYSPAADYDGHFVAFKNTDAKNDVDRFLVDAVSGVIPQVGR